MSKTIQSLCLAVGLGLAGCTKPTIVGTWRYVGPGVNPSVTTIEFRQLDNQLLTEWEAPTRAGKPKRIRSGDGIYVLDGRRVTFYQSSGYSATLGAYGIPGNDEIFDSKPHTFTWTVLKLSGDRLTISDPEIALRDPKDAAPALGVETFRRFASH